MKKVLSIAFIIACSMMVFSCKNGNKAAEEAEAAVDSTCVECADSTVAAVADSTVAEVEGAAEAAAAEIAK